MSACFRSSVTRKKAPPSEKGTLMPVSKFFSSLCLIGNNSLPNSSTPPRRTLEFGFSSINNCVSINADSKDSEAWENVLLYALQFR